MVTTGEIQFKNIEREGKAIYVLRFEEFSANVEMTEPRVSRLLTERKALDCKTRHRK